MAGEAGHADPGLRDAEWEQLNERAWRVQLAAWSVERRDERPDQTDLSFFIPLRRCPPENNDNDNNARMVVVQTMPPAVEVGRSLAPSELSHAKSVLEA